MLIQSSALIDTPVLSLQTGGQLAVVSGLVIDPGNLHIVAFELTGKRLDVEQLFLRVNEIREVSEMGIIVDSSDDFVELDDVITLSRIYAYQFNPIDMRVIDNHKRTIGKVVDTVTDPKHFIITQLNVKRPLLKSFNEAEILIHRRQILEINDNEIIVKAPSEKASSRIEPVTKEYVNPFRKQSQVKKHPSKP